MNTERIPCPIIGLMYEKHERGGRCYYSLSPDDGYRMRVRLPSETGELQTNYLSRLAFPHPYDFETNEKQVESEAL